MSEPRRMFSICIPAYNRVVHLPVLLDSIYKQSFSNFEIVICEDLSKERPEIAKVVAEYSIRYPGTLRYYENTNNLGYDGNIRNLVNLARGEYCFFMGNDDIMCEGSLAAVSERIKANDNIGFVLKSYAWFDEVPTKINQEVRYFNEEKFLAAGTEAISVCFRRSGVISGFIIHRDTADGAATSEFDGTLYYQMHIVGVVLAKMNAITMPKVLVLCRNSEPPDFGNSASEKGIYTPGTYTPAARINMISGVIRIATALEKQSDLPVTAPIMRDYANYFYPYIRDQLKLPFSDYYKLYRAYGRIGFNKYPMFHAYFIICYCFGANGFDRLTAYIRKTLGRSPHFGSVK
ncbi:glycosyltransferase family 2 protein [Janthinobacterium sp. SUN073]|uniref:glycosyltransferase family 2 protein n=1 Tax=Janthinobacterium sp. SUN073 TaxID=3004102 RepID=UPI0025AFA81F|nr:glycosyltransferase family 2 protein [Janthinobacterium sp. SUN073]MDN2696112.1 glycosyltransferase family 2 protein [Janthinobacterium sp. SUN073]